MVILGVILAWILLGFLCAILLTAIGDRIRESDISVCIILAPVLYVFCNFHTIGKLAPLNRDSDIGDILLNIVFPIGMLQSIFTFLYRLVARFSVSNNIIKFLEYKPFKQSKDKRKSKLENKIARLQLELKRNE